MKGNGYADKNKMVYSLERPEDHFKNISQTKGTCLIQTALKNLPSWMKFTSESLATWRLVTAGNPDSGEIIPLFCCLKKSVGNSDVDHYALGGLIAPVDLESGEIGEAVTTHSEFLISGLKRLRLSSELH